LKEEALDRTKWKNHFGRGFGPVVWQITDDDFLCILVNLCMTPNYVLPQSAAI
jgi:hypothetical protein